MKKENVIRLKSEIEAGQRATIALFDYLLAEREIPIQSTARVKQPKPIAASITEAIEGMTGNFTVEDIFNAVEKARKPAHEPEMRREIISVVINRLKNAGKVKIVEPGAGSRSGTYSKV